MEKRLLLLRKVLLLLLLLSPLSAIGQQGFVNGKAKFQEGNYAKALTLFESAKKSGVSDNGKKEIDEYIERTKRCKDLRDKADKAYTKGDYAAAGTYYKELLKVVNNPDDPVALERYRANGDSNPKQQTQTAQKQQTQTAQKQQTQTAQKQQTQTTQKQQTQTTQKQQTQTARKQQTQTARKQQTQTARKQQTQTAQKQQKNATTETMAERNARQAAESFAKAKQFYASDDYELALSQLAECKRLGLWGNEQQKLQRDVYMSRDYTRVLECTSQLTVINSESAAQACRDFIANYPVGPNVVVMKGLLYNYYVARRDYTKAREYANATQARNLDNLRRPNSHATKLKHGPKVGFGVFGDAMLPLLPECGLTIRIGGMDERFNLTLSLSHQWMHTDTAQSWNHWTMVESGTEERSGWYGECNMIRYRQWNIQSALRLNIIADADLSPYIELGGQLSFNTGGQVFVPSMTSDYDLIALTNVNPVKLLGGSVQATVGVSWRRLDLYLFARYTVSQPYDIEALDKLYLFDVTPGIGESKAYDVDGLSATQILQMVQTHMPYSYYRVQNLMESSSKFAEALDNRFLWGAGIKIYIFNSN